jgi:long-chain acyl-CoA synthetase
LPVPGVEVMIDAPNDNGEGEILARGPNIMQGYFNQPALTAEVLMPDGWLRTGDVGKLVNKRFLAITGRKKDIFKTTAGIYIAPQELESHVAASPFISQCLVYGFNKPFVAAVLVPHTALLKSWCDDNGIHWTSLQFMVYNIKVVQKFQQEIDRLNEALPNYKRIKKFLLTDTEWTVDNGLLTPSFKIIRTKVQAQYQVELERLYS